MRRQLRRVPAPLLALLAVVVVEALAWTFAVPPLQGADESGHVAYIQKVADAHEIPWGSGGYLERDNLATASSEMQRVWLYAATEALRGNTGSRPGGTSADEAIWRASEKDLPSDGRTNGQNVGTFANPPLYYLYASIPYELATKGSFFERMYLVRVANLPFLLVTVLMTWLLVGEVLGRRRRVAQTIASAAVALQPGLLDVTTRVTPDALLIALSATALWLAARIVRGKDGRREHLALVGVIVAASLTQSRGIGLVLPALVAVAIAAAGRRRAAGRSVPRAALLGAGAVLLAVIVVVYVTRGRVSEIPGFLSYLWQFYLPKLPGMATPIGPPWGSQDVYLDRLFTTYVQFEVGLPNWGVDLLRLAFYAGLALLVAACWQRRDLLRRDGAMFTMLAAWLALVVLALHAAAFRALLVNRADPVITGRYLLPLLPLYGLAVALSLRALPRRVGPYVTGGVVAGAACLQLAALGVVVERFYA